MVWSEHRAVEFADGTAISAGFLVMIASVVAFNGTAARSAARSVARRDVARHLLATTASTFMVFDHYQLGEHRARGLAAAVTLQAFPSAWVDHMPRAIVAALTAARVWIADVAHPRPGGTRSREQCGGEIADESPVCAPVAPLRGLGLLPRRCTSVQALGPCC